MYLKGKVKSWMLMGLCLTCLVAICYGAYRAVVGVASAFDAAQPHTQICITIWMSAWALGFILQGQRTTHVTITKDDEP